MRLLPEHVTGTDMLRACTEESGGKKVFDVHKSMHIAAVMVLEGFEDGEELAMAIIAQMRSKGVSIKKCQKTWISIIEAVEAVQFIVNIDTKFDEQGRLTKLTLGGN